MKIHKLIIEKFRGIKSITLEPKGNNLVVFGSNGTGKSAIVDAIDFLLTGKISRLEGEGTEFLSTKAHGPHIDHEPKDAEVKAVVELPGVKGLINLERKMSQPLKLIYDAKCEKAIVPILEVASLGLHKLSRKEILKYIMAEAGKRATEVQALLDLQLVDKIRKSLVTVKNNAEKSEKSSSDNLERTKTEIKTILNLKTQFTEDECLTQINQLRGVFKADSLKILDKDELKKNIAPIVGKNETDAQSLDFLRNSIKILKETLTHKDEIVREDECLQKLIQTFNKDAQLRREVAQSKLIQLGFALVGEDNSCPLCKKEWDNGHLKEFLNERIKASVKGQEQINEAIKQANKYKPTVLECKNLLTNLLPKYQALKLKKNEKSIQDANDKLTQFFPKLADPIELYRVGDNVLKDFFGKQLGDLIDGVEEEIVSLQYEASPEEKAWTILTKLEVLLAQYLQAKVVFNKSTTVHKQADLVLTIFEKSRDSNLGSIFDKINTDFVTFYKILHEEDEKDFESTFVPKEAKLLFEVDFHKRGKFHPGALHSEGHQDSMGLCLFLALNKFLAEEKLAICVLDDVVMSIDTGHRRNTCKLLQAEFSNRQFIITTHDDVWARQLRTEGIVKSENMTEFRWWSLDTGPLTGDGDDFWNSIEEDLKANKVREAAWKLRRNAERFLNQVCGQLRSQIIFRDDGGWQLGDYMPSAVSKFKKLLDSAIKSATSFGKADIVKELQELDKNFTDAVSRTQAEQWATNAAIHYNNWENFNEKELRPVVETFKGLFSFFLCKGCGSMLHVVTKDLQEEGLRCRCKIIDWNLVRK